MVVMNRSEYLKMFGKRLELPHYLSVASHVADYNQLSMLSIQFSKVTRKVADAFDSPALGELWALCVNWVARGREQSKRYG